MKINYQIELEKILNSLTNKPKLLLHACCGICSSYVLEYLEPYFEITVLFYNPNIYPNDEYQKRYKTEEELIKKMNKKIKLVEIGYNQKDFYTKIKGLEHEKEGGSRCTICYSFRMEQAAIYAKNNNYDYFCTTLSISPYKDAQKLNKIGQILQDKYKIKYLYSDFKKKDGFKKTNLIANKYNLYRQNYCGCEFSKIESENYQNR